MNSNIESENNVAESELLQVDDAGVEDLESSDENTGPEDLLPTGSLEQSDEGETSFPIEAGVSTTDSDAVIDEDELFEEEDSTPKKESPYDRPGKWFVVHTQSGYENKVKQNLETRT